MIFCAASVAYIFAIAASTVTRPPPVSRRCAARATKVSTREMGNPGRTASDKSLDLFHLHWPSFAFDLDPLEHFPVPVPVHRALRRTPVLRRLYKSLLPALRKGADAFARDWIVASFEKEIDEWLGKVEACGIPLLWQQHDLLSHNNKVRRDFRSSVDAYLHHRLYAVCDRLIVHEASCLEPIFSHYGGPKPYSIVPIGRLSDRAAVPKAEAREPPRPA